MSHRTYFKAANDNIISIYDARYTSRCLNHRNTNLSIRPIAVFANALYIETHHKQQTTSYLDIEKELGDFEISANAKGSQRN